VQASEGWQNRHLQVLQAGGRAALVPHILGFAMRACNDLVTLSAG
jgi:hypothetical protein